MAPSILLPTGESMVRFIQTCRTRHYDASIGPLSPARLIRINPLADCEPFVVLQQPQPPAGHCKHLMYIKETGDGDCYAARAHSGHHQKILENGKSGAQRLL